MSQLESEPDLGDSQPRAKESVTAQKTLAQIMQEEMEELRQMLSVEEERVATLEEGTSRTGHEVEQALAEIRSYQSETRKKIELVNGLVKVKEEVRKVDAELRVEEQNRQLLLRCQVCPGPPM